MKKVFSMFLAVCIILALVSCTKDGTQPQPPLETPTPTQTQNVTPIIVPTETNSMDSDDIDATKPHFDGRIAIISNYSGQNEEYDSAQLVVNEYGEEEVIHITWPTSFVGEQQAMIDMVTELGADPDIKAIIVNRAELGSNAAFEKLRETRKDIFVIYIESYEDSTDSTQIANILLRVDELGMGSAMVQQAQKLGAKTFIHYSFKRHMSQPILSERRERIKEECEKISIKFIDATSPDPQSDIGMSGAQQFILEDVPKMVEKYGQDTAFFCTNCGLQPPLIQAVVETGAIYPQPCCPSPYHGIVTALNLNQNIYKNDKLLPVKDIISKERAAIAKENMLGRISTWPDLSSDVLTMASAEYAIKWINGEVPKEGVDIEVLKQLMEDYAGVDVYLTPYTDKYPYTDEGTGETYDNFLMMRMDYLTFE